MKTGMKQKQRWAAMRPTSFCGPRQGWIPGLAPVLRAPSLYLCSFSALFLGLLAGSGPAASNFLLLRQKKVTKEKATRSLGPCASLRATCAARLRRGLAQTRLRLKHARSLIRLRLRCSAQPGRGKSGIPNTRKPNTKINTNKDSPRRVLVVFGARYLSLAVWYSCLHPLWMRRGAEVQADQGSRCLSEAQRSEFSETPPGPSTAGCP